MKNKEKNVDIIKFGLNQREFLILFLLHELSYEMNYPKSLHEKLSVQFPEKIYSYDYVCKVAKRMAGEKYLLLKPADRRNYFYMTDKGHELYSYYKDSLYSQLHEINLVLDRFLRDLTGSGPLHPVEKQLPNQYKAHFSKLVSIRDLVRYVTLKEANLRHSISVSEIKELLKIKFGWESSNSYLYDISAEMEKSGLLTGEWEREKRSRRLLRITIDGTYYYRELESLTKQQLLIVQKSLKQILTLLDSK